MHLDVDVFIIELNFIFSWHAFSGPHKSVYKILHLSSSFSLCYFLCSFSNFFAKVFAGLEESSNTT